MAAIDQYIERIADENLRGEIQMELVCHEECHPLYNC